MLQLRTTAAATRSSTLNVCQTSRTVNARLCAPLKVPSQQLLQSESKVGPRGSSLALQAHRGDEVAAFLVASDIQDPGVLPGTAPSAVSQKLQIYSTQWASCGQKWHGCCAPTQGRCGCRMLARSCHPPLTALCWS